MLPMINDDVPSGEEVFAQAIQEARAEGFNERKATLRAALATAAWTIATSDQAVAADTFEDLRSSLLDKIHHEFDGMVERALSFDQAPRRRRP